MEKRPLIFVSHSSKDRQLTEAVCEGLRSRPGTPGQGYDVLVDYTDLQPGVEWPRQLHEYMARCQAAVILLTPKAVVSPWVLKEATILTWRCSLDSNFKLFPVRFPGVSDQLLEREKFDPLFLDRIQQIDTDDAVAIAEAVEAAVGDPQQVDTPFDRLVGFLSDLFENVGAHTLRTVAEKVRVEPPRWRADSDLREQYIHEICRHLVCEDLGDYAGVHKLIDDLSMATEAEVVHKIFRIVSPYWVDAEAAGRLPSLAIRSPRACAALNGSFVSEYTAKMYVRRAHPLTRLSQVVSTAGGSAGDFLGHVTREICNHVRQDENRPVEKDDTIVAELEGRTDPLYVVLPPPIPDNEALNELRNRFPRITFILGTGDELEPDDILQNVEWLMPPLDLDQERREYEHCRRALSIIRKMKPF